MKEYDFKSIEKKWQDIWAKEKYGQSEDFTKKPKHYHLVEFPYPSGAGLHVGHCMGYGASDAYCRMKRLQGYNVMYPMGWDAFGLPTENYAIKNKIKPADATAKNVAAFKTQMKSLGYAFDWPREVNTTDPDYYRWTQWIFLQFYKHAIVDDKLVEVADDDKTTPRLAFQAEMPVNWCPSCRIVLANEEVIAGNCERCGAQTTVRKQKQWMLRITAYADRLIKDLDTVDYLNKIKTQQINWIGRSEGVILKEKVKDMDIQFEVYDSVPQTFVAQTFTVIAPEHPIVERLVKGTKYEKPVLDFVEKIKKKKLQNKFDIENDLEGIFTGRYIDNPFGYGDLEIWVASYVVADYGTGIVNCSAHDERDFKFAKKYNIPLRIAMLPPDPKLAEKVRNLEVYFGHDESGIITEPRQFNGMTWKEARLPIIDYIEEKEYGRKAVQFKLRDWIFSRQHYWGEPIPIVYCENCVKDNTGVKISFPIKDSSEKIEITTNHPETIFGATFLALSPSHKQSKLSSARAINPANREELPIFVTNYIESQNLGAKIGVPAHDQQDYEFAKNNNIPIKQVIAPSYLGEGKDKPRDDKETVKRHAMLALVKHWNEDKYYLLDWDKFDWKTLVIGGIEEGETGEEAVKREVMEETGYLDIKDVKKIGFQIVNNFFARHKDVNRYGWFDCYLVKLGSDKFVMPDPEEVKNHTGHWVEADNVENFLNLENHKYFWRTFEKGAEPFTGQGVLINSSKFNDLPSKDAIGKISIWLIDNGFAKYDSENPADSTIIDGKKYARIPIPEDQLPVTLPEVENYEPTDTGESPLAKITDWVNTTCPKCGGPAKRETDTMPNWAGSSWYYMAYAMRVKSEKLKVESTNLFQDAKDELDYWMPVDMYNGGMEHTTLHLLYSRFWNKFLYDLGVAPTSEPYAKRIAHGIILGPDGRKMSKSFGNVINPDDIASQYGADTLRAYIMFIGPYDQESAWNTAGVQGVFRFLKRVWVNADKISEEADSKELLIKLNQTIAGVSEDLEAFRMNTVISKLMEMNNMIEKAGHISKESFGKYLTLLYTATPHIASELWEIAGLTGRIEASAWPSADPKYLVAEKIEIPIQINGKVRDKIYISPETSDDELKQKALESSRVKEFVGDKEIKKVIVVSKKLVSIVV